MFIGTEEMLINYLQPIAPNNVGVKLPGDMPADTLTFPYIKVTRIGGPDDQITECALAQVEVFHFTRDLAESTARQMHSLMHQLKPYTLGLTAGGQNVRVDRVEVVNGPRYQNYKDENLVRYVARYEIQSRITSQNP